MPLLRGLINLLVSLSRAYFILKGWNDSGFSKLGKCPPLAWICFKFGGFWLMDSINWIPWDESSPFGMKIFLFFQASNKQIQDENVWRKFCRASQNGQWSLLFREHVHLYCSVWSGYAFFEYWSTALCNMMYLHFVLVTVNSNSVCCPELIFIAVFILLHGGWWVVGGDTAIGVSCVNTWEVLFWHCFEAKHITTTIHLTKAQKKTAFQAGELN